MYAFDLLFLNGEDLRALPLIERKARLKRLLRRKRSPVLYVDHIETHGRPFFARVCELELEGIVAKRKVASYQATDKPSPYWAGSAWGRGRGGRTATEEGAAMKCRRCRLRQSQHLSLHGYMG